MFLYCRTSTLKPIVGIVWIFSSESFWSRSAKNNNNKNKNKYTQSSRTIKIRISISLIVATYIIWWFSQRYRGRELIFALLWIRRATETVDWWIFPCYTLSAFYQIENELVRDKLLCEDFKITRSNLWTRSIKHASSINPGNATKLSQNRLFFFLHSLYGNLTQNQ